MGGNGRQEDHASELREFLSLKKVADATSSYEDSKYVIFGVPFDCTSSFRRGSRKAPAAIREHYDNLESFDSNYGINYPDIPIADLGDLSVGEDAEEVVNEVENIVRIIRSDGKIPIMLGGEHSITVGAVRNFRDSLFVVIDAHSDFRLEYFGNPFNHACVTRRALELLGPGRCISVGTRSVSMEEFQSDQWKDVRFISSREVSQSGIGKVVREILDYSPGSIYFSIDMDGIDPSYAPGVGTPEPYGLRDSDVRYMINELSPIIEGFDIVEITPVYDNGNTSMLAAKFIQDFIGSREGKRKF